MRGSPSLRWTMRAMALSTGRPEGTWRGRFGQKPFKGSLRAVGTAPSEVGLRSGTMFWMPTRTMMRHSMTSPPTRRSSAASATMMRGSMCMAASWERTDVIMRSLVAHEGGLEGRGRERPLQGGDVARLLGAGGDGVGLEVHAEQQGRAFAAGDVVRPPRRDGGLGEAQREADLGVAVGPELALEVDVAGDHGAVAEEEADGRVADRDGVGAGVVQGQGRVQGPVLPEELALRHAQLRRLVVAVLHGLREPVGELPGPRGTPLERGLVGAVVALEGDGAGDGEVGVLRVLHVLGPPLDDEALRQV